MLDPVACHALSDMNDKEIQKMQDCKAYRCNRTGGRVLAEQVYNIHVLAYRREVSLMSYQIARKMHALIRRTVRVKILSENALTCFR